MFSYSAPNIKSLKSIDLKFQRTRRTYEHGSEHTFCRTSRYPSTEHANMHEIHNYWWNTEFWTYVHARTISERMFSEHMFTNIRTYVQGLSKIYACFFCSSSDKCLQGVGIVLCHPNLQAERGPVGACRRRLQLMTCIWTVVQTVRKPCVRDHLV